MKPQKAVPLRPNFGIGVVIGAGILVVGQASGSDPVLGLVLGGGAGILLGLTRRPGGESLLPTGEEASVEEKR